MDEFMSAVLAAIHEHGSRAVHVFPPASQVLIYFADRLANEVVCAIHSSGLSRLTFSRLGSTSPHCCPVPVN